MEDHDQNGGMHVHKGNNDYQDQLPMGCSRGDIFIDHYWINQEVYILEFGLTPYLTLESNEYHLTLIICLF